ncbi:MAG: amidohydrolase family protein [Phycisphaerales bacterium]
MSDCMMHNRTFRRTLHRTTARSIAAAGLTVAVGLMPAIASASVSSASAISASAIRDGHDHVILAPHVLMPDGSLADDMAVHVVDGAIKQIGSMKDFADHPNATRLPDGAVLSPGLIDLAASVGVRGANSSTTEVLDPNPSVVEAFDPHAPGVRAALEAGITAVMIIPGPNGLVDGATATVRTAPEDDGSADVLNAEGAMMFSMGSAALATANGPTSRAGAMQLLRSTMRNMDKNDGSRMSRVMGGDMPAVLVADAPEDVSAMLRLMDRQGVVPTIYAPNAAVEVAAEVAEYEGAAIVGPLGFRSGDRLLMGADALDAAGVPIAFAGGLPNNSPDQLRMTAAIAVRAGVDPDAARRGLTSTAARIAGVEDTIGSIAVGHAADFTIFSGDPLRMDSRVLEVHVRGHRVHAASH